MSLEELLAQSIEDEEKRQQVLDAIKQDRAGLEANKQKVLDDLKKQQERSTKMEGTLQSLQSAFGDRTPDDVKAMMERLENDEMTRLAAEGKTDEILKKHKEKWDAERKSAEQSWQQQLEEANNQNAELKQSLTKELVDNRAMAAASRAGVIPEAMEDLTMLARSQWQLEDNEPVLRDKDGNIITGKKGALTFEEWASEQLRESRPHWFPQPVGSRAPGNNGSAQTKANPWKGDQRNLTEQARIKKNEPELAKRLMSEAGIQE